MVIHRKNIFTGRQNSMDVNVTKDQLDLWVAGALIQDVMPDLTADEREFLISGLLPSEFEAMFGEEE